MTEITPPPRRQKKVMGSSVDVAVIHAHLKMAFPDVVGEFFSHDDRAVPAAGAADGDREGTFAFLDIMRQRLCHHAEEFLSEALGLRRLKHKPANGRVTAGFKS